jgi:hypothetical protein
MPKKTPNNYIIFNKVIIIIYKGFLALKCISIRA